jgi:hypothetical protein
MAYLLNPAMSCCNDILRTLPWSHIRTAVEPFTGSFLESMYEVSALDVCDGHHTQSVTCVTAHSPQPSLSG